MREFAEVGTYHKELHKVAEQLVTEYNRGNIENANKQYIKLQEPLKNLVQTLDKLIVKL